MAIFLSASTLGAPDLLKLHNQTAAYWAWHIIRLVGIRQGRACYYNVYVEAAESHSSLRAGVYLEIESGAGIKTI